jgi:hypothetical protein
MPQKFRVTCARTSYFEVEIEADGHGAVEQQFAAILERRPELWDQVEQLGKPIYRLVEVAPAEAGVEVAANPRSRAA